MLNFHNKKALVRVDFNVPLDSEFNITDDTRMRAAIPTIKKILEDGGAVVLMSHLGRPQKKRKEDGSIDVDKFTLKHLTRHLSDLLGGVSVKFCPETVGEKAEQMVKNLGFGEVLLLENTRFNPGETKGDESLAKAMSKLGEVYVNDAFGTAHRAHSSTAIVAKFFPKENKTFGLLMEAEIANANKVIKTPQRPLTAITGGAKVSDKILLLDKLIDFVDHLIIGGGMAYTFFKAQGGKVGNSLVEEDKLDLALALLKKAAEKGVEIHLPEDSLIADAFSNDAKIQVCSNRTIPDGWMGLDIGPRAIDTFSAVILSSQTILWNGPMGVFEMPNFAKGTKSIANAVAQATQKGAFSLIGGGDSVAAINQLKLADQVSYVSTGGGAMLKFLEGNDLPGIAAIKK